MREFDVAQANVDAYFARFTESLRALIPGAATRVQFQALPAADAGLRGCDAIACLRGCCTITSPVLADDDPVVVAIAVTKFREGYQLSASIRRKRSGERLYETVATFTNAELAMCATRCLSPFPSNTTGPDTFAVAKVVDFYNAQQHELWIAVKLGCTVLSPALQHRCTEDKHGQQVLDDVMLVPELITTPRFRKDTPFTDDDIADVVRDISQELQRKLVHAVKLMREPQDSKFSIEAMLVPIGTLPIRVCGQMR